MDAPAQVAGPAIEGRTQIAEHDIFESHMCDIPAGSGGLSVASENAIVVSPFFAGTIVCLRTRGKPTAAQVPGGDRVVDMQVHGAETSFAIETRGPGNSKVAGPVRFQRPTCFTRKSQSFLAYNLAPPLGGS